MKIAARRVFHQDFGRQNKSQVSPRVLTHAFSNSFYFLTSFQCLRVNIFYQFAACWLAESMASFSFLDKVLLIVPGTVSKFAGPDQFDCCWQGCIWRLTKLAICYPWVWPVSSWWPDWIMFPFPSLYRISFLLVKLAVSSSRSVPRPQALTGKDALIAFCRHFSSMDAREGH